MKQKQRMTEQKKIQKYDIRCRCKDINSGFNLSVLKNQFVFKLVIILGQCCDSGSTKPTSMRVIQIRETLSRGPFRSRCGLVSAIRGTLLGACSAGNYQYAACRSSDLPRSRRTKNTCSSTRTSRDNVKNCMTHSDSGDYIGNFTI